MIKVTSVVNGLKASQAFEADSFENSDGYLMLRKKGETVASFAAGFWSSVEKEEPKSD